MEEEKYKILNSYYARLVGIRAGFPNSSIRQEIVTDYNNLVDNISKTLEIEMNDFKIPGSSFYPPQSYQNFGSYDRGVSKFKIEQLLSYLEISFGLGEKVQEIGSLINAIKDQDLRDRCFDLLSASSNFDRVINQATLILEDRIRVKSQVKDKLEGVKLVNTVLNPNLSKTILKVSSDEDGHRGICDICRGVMSSFRNSTHHHLSDKFSREDALKFCGFIDILLNIIDNSTINK
ncbi:MAG: TIGR02391 family protein [Patescibacteria group bacterium]|nr:TIGR02391 family protein [Patescibacteria group bacterium]